MFLIKWLVFVFKEGIFWGFFFLGECDNCRDYKDVFWFFILVGRFGGRYSRICGEDDVRLEIERDGFFYFRGLEKERDFR